MDKQQLLNVLNEEDVATCEVTYSGSSDSGYVEHPVCLDKDGHEIKISKTLTDIIENFVYDELESRYGGWEINDGAEGRVEFNVAESSIKMTHTEFYTESNTFETELGEEEDELA